MKKLFFTLFTVIFVAIIALTAFAAEATVYVKDGGSDKLCYTFLQGCKPQSFERASGTSHSHQLSIKKSVQNAHSFLYKLAKIVNFC